MSAVLMGLWLATAHAGIFESDTFQPADTDMPFEVDTDFTSDSDTAADTDADTDETEVIAVPDTATVDTGYPTGGLTAADLANEPGGCGCNAGAGTGTGLMAVLLIVVAARRREDSFFGGFGHDRLG